MSRYKVILSNGETVNVPSDKARSKYESIRVYGISAVLERAHRARAYKSAAASGYTIRAVVYPDGTEVTQF